MMRSSRTSGHESREAIIRLLGSGFLAFLAFAVGFVTWPLVTDGSSSVIPVVAGLVTIIGVWLVLNMFWSSARSVQSKPDYLGAAAIAASSDAMALVQDGERVLEANAAYRELCRSTDGPLPNPESFLARMPGTQVIVSELLASIANRESARRVIRVDSGMNARQMEISVYPVGGSTRQVLWDLRLREQAPLAPSEQVQPQLALLETPPQPVPVAPVQVNAAAPEPQSQPQAHVHNSDAAQRLLEVWELAPAGVARLNSSRIHQANAGMCRMLGYGLAEWGVDGLRLHEVIAPEQMEALHKALQPGARPASFILEVTRKDGGTLPVFMRLGIVDRAGEATVVILPLAAWPVEARPVAPPATLQAAPVLSPAVPAMQAVSASANAAADQFFMRAPLALAVVDGQGRMGAVNDAFVRVFTDGGKASGIALTQAVSEQDRDAVEGFLAAARAEGAAVAICEVAVNGRSARLYGSPLGADGAVALCAMETTEQKAFEAQYAQSQRLQAVGHLAGGVAHDFNNVLTAIIGNCDLLLLKHRPSDPSFPDIMQIKQNANRAAALVRQLLAFSRRQTLRPQVIELTDAISDVSELLRRLIGERITLNVQHARDLWPVKADVNQFEQVIVNLAVNARDAMPNGGTLTLRTANVPASASASYGQGLPEEDYVLVEVQDTGEGIPADIIDKIFEPFFSTKEVGKGTGLGLSTVYGIVQQTGGTILAASEPGQGATFRVFLPRHVPGTEEETPRAPEPEVKVGDSTGHGCILLVEDEDAVRTFASRALTGRGYEVLTAASGVEALEVMEGTHKQVDLVISDVVMPEMDGPSLLRELRARDPALKVIFISGYAEEAFAKNLPPEEHFSFLPKPFSLKQLVGAVNGTLRGTE